MASIETMQVRAWQESPGACNQTSVKEQVDSPPVVASLIDPLSADWDRLVASNPASNIFQSAAWSRVLSETYGHKPFYLHFSQLGRTVALLPFMEVSSPFTGRRGVSLPFSDFCRPLTYGPLHPDVIVTELSQLARKQNWKYFELRDAPNFRSFAKPVTKFYGHRLDLTAGPQELFGRFASAVRRGIRKGERSGITVRATGAKEAIRQFYALHVRTRRRHGVPPQPSSFFSKIYEHVVKPGLGFVVLAEKGSRLLAGAVFFRWRENAVFKYGASDERLQEFRANNLVMWEGIKHLAGTGAKVLHFGRTEVQNAGLRRFKLAWGAEEENLEYFRFDPVSAQWLTGQRKVPGFASAVFSRMPLAGNRLIGTIFYPHMD